MTLSTTALDTVMLGVVYASVFEQIVANKPSVVMLSVMLPNGAIIFYFTFLKKLGLAYLTSKLF